MGGYIYYDTLTTGTNFSVGEVASSSNSKSFIVVSHDTVKKRLLVHKRTTDAAGTPSSLTGPSSAYDGTFYAYFESSFPIQKYPS